MRSDTIQAFQISDTAGTSFEGLYPADCRSSELGSVTVQTNTKCPGAALPGSEACYPGKS